MISTTLLSIISPVTQKNKNDPLRKYKIRAARRLLLQVLLLLLNDLKDFHGADLDTDAAGDALGDGVAFLVDHDLHGADLNALAALDTLLLVDHVHAGLGILSNGLMLTDLHALAALDADIGLGTLTLCNDLQARVILMEFLIKCFGASPDTLQTSHAGDIFLNRELLHNRGSSYILYSIDIILSLSENSNGRIQKKENNFSGRAEGTPSDHSQTDGDTIRVTNDPMEE